VQDHVMKILIGVAILVIAGTIGLVANDHNTIVVHGEKLEEVKSLKAVVNDLRTSNTDIKVAVEGVKAQVTSLNEKTNDIRDAVNGLKAADRRRQSR
jgi:uncharacterized membrane protein (DUF106 family)